MSYRRFFTYFILPVLAVVFFDLYTKHLAMNYFISGESFGPLQLKAVQNYSGFLGTYFNLSFGALIVMTSTLALMVVTVAIFALMAFPQQIMMFSISLGLLCGGIVSNVMSRLTFGFVTDWFGFGMNPPLATYYNLADVAQIVGLLLALITLVRDSKKILSAYEFRRNYFVNPQFQLKFTGHLMMLMTVIFTFVALISSAYFRFNFSCFMQFTPFVFIMAELYLALLLLTFLFGIVVSHRIAGPLYRFKQSVVAVMNNESSQTIKFREHDDLQDELNEIYQIIKNKK